MQNHGWKDHRDITLKQYQQALWDYFMEHCEVEPDGSFFVKFHIRKKTQHEGHVIARWQGHHREDPRAKEALGDRRQYRMQMKAEARGRYEAMKEVSRQRQRRRLFWQRLFRPFRRFLSVRKVFPS